MKIVFNTTQRYAPCSMFYIDAFKRMKEMSFFDQNFDLYDIALFMTYDHEMVEHVRKLYPNLIIGIIDPRSHKVFKSTQHCDFLILDSIEMEDFWRVSRKPIFRYAEYPDIPYVKKTHEEKNKISIGYHGNQIHLECMAETTSRALTELGKKYDLELLVMHNGHPPNGKEAWYPKNVSVRHVPWRMENYINELGNCDIGIVPNNLVHNDTIKKAATTDNQFNYSLDDYSLRFKMPSNPGRFIVFGKLGIPVVADFYPSALQHLQNGTGFVAHNPGGWYYCLEKLITSRDLRQKMGESLQCLVKNKFDFDSQNEKLKLFFQSLLQK